MSYFRWTLGNDVSLFLELVQSDGTGLTGSDPQVMIRRFRNVDGSGFLDNYYWNGTSSFVASAISHSMQQVDATTQPGVYVYTFSQSLIQSASVYNVMFRHNATPVGFATERHYFVRSGSEGSINVYESEID